MVVFVPNRLYYDPYYSTTYHLNAYSHRVNENTSEELSLPGSLWMLGGIIPVFFGGIATGLLHTGVMKWIMSATRKSPYQGLFYLAIIAGTILFGFNLDFISHARAVVRGMLLATILWYCVVTWILGRSAQSASIIRRRPLGIPV